MSSLVKGVCGIHKEQYDETFEYLLKNYLSEKLYIKNISLAYIKSNYERLGLSQFGTVYYTEGGVKQFVNEMTKEVLFEVGVEVKDRLFDSVVWYKEYWK